MQVSKSADRLIYADLRLNVQHPAGTPPIRTEPPTQYADIRHYLVPHADSPPASKKNGWDPGEEDDEVEGSGRGFQQENGQRRYPLP